MIILHRLLRPLEAFNVRLLRLAQWGACALLAVMVLTITFQIIMRPISPQGWTTPLAKLLMLWMIGLAAPVAYRSGGFVGIDLLERALPRLASQLLTLLILLLSGVVLYFGVRLGADMVGSFTGKGTIPGMRIDLSWVGLDTIKVRNKHAFASLYLGMILLFIVNIELLLRHLIRMGGGAAQLSPITEGGIVD